MTESVRYQGPQRICHRGLQQAAPENTIEAFQAAVDQKMEGAELDIRSSQDGEIVVFHDADLSRMTFGHPAGLYNRRIEDLTWSELENIEISYAGSHLLNYFPEDGFPIELETLFPWQLDTPEKIRSGVRSWAARTDAYDLSGPVDFYRQLESRYRRQISELFARDSRTARIVRLQDVLQWLDNQPGDFSIEIEYKMGGMMPALADLLARSPVCHRCLLMSGDPTYIDEIQQYFRQHGKPAGLRLGANIRQMTPERYAACQTLNLYEVGLDAQRFTHDDILRLEAMGIVVFANLGDYPAWWLQLNDLKPAGFKTNF